MGDLSLSKVEYRVREIKRYIVTRYTETDNGRAASGSVTKGEYASADTAYDVAYALCAHEHAALGWDLGDKRISYPSRIADALCIRRVHAEADINPQDTAITQDA